jgi:hypothetical protein
MTVNIQHESAMSFIRSTGPIQQVALHDKGPVPVDNGKAVGSSRFL